jgi:predicted PurR-regulated permease PerM
METPAPKRVLLDISWTAIFRILAVAASLWLVDRLSDILLMLCGVVLFIAIVHPIVRHLQERMSRLVAVFLVYLTIFAVVILVFWALLPTLVHQINDLGRVLPGITLDGRRFLEAHQARQYVGLLDQVTNFLHGAITTLSHTLLDSTVSIFGGLATLVSGIVVSFYLLLEERNAHEFLHQVLPGNRFEPIYGTIRKISERLGAWARGQLLLMLIIGGSNLIGFMILRLHSPLPLAVWAGVCEVIPFVGPYLGMIPAVIIALTTGTVLQAVLVLVVSFVVIQQLEAHIVVPKVMSRAVGLSPVLVILALLVGVRLFGILGAVISVPTAAVLSVIAGEWPQLRLMWEGEHS